MLKDKFDINSIFDNGFQIARMNPDMADFYLRRVSRENYVDDPFQNYEEKDYKEKEIFNRMFAKWSLEKKIPEIYKELGQSFCDTANPLIRLYNNGKPTTDMTLNLMKAKPGYRMGWHEDISDSAPFLGFLYLIPEDLTKEDGGQLEIARVTRNSEGDVVSRDVIASITPEHGMLILLENQTTRFQHRVAELNCEKERYLILTTLGGVDF